MNIAEANTEPFYQFHRFNEGLNRIMRVTVAGLATIEQATTQSQRPIQLLTDGEPWGPNKWNDPAREIIPAKRFLAQMGVVRVITALEDFCVGVKAEYDRYSESRGGLVKAKDRQGADDEGISPTKLYTELGWTKETLDVTGPLYEYFSKVRNCVVHRLGRASKELHKYAGGLRLKECVNAWHSTGAKKLPALPTVTIGGDTPLLPRHSILASEVCRRIAVDANQRLLRHLGVDGVVLMAAYHSLFSDTPIRTGARKSPQAVLNWILTDRYRVKLEYREEAIRILGRLGKWKPYLRKFEKLQGNKASS